MTETMGKKVEEYSRRHFLRIAGGISLTAAVGAAAYYYGIRPGPVVPPQTSITTSSSSITTVTSPYTPTTETTEKLASLNGRLFFDYNGNGTQDGEEPAVSDAKVQLKDDTGKVIADAVTDSSGNYKLEDVKTGSYGLFVEPDKESKNNFRYMCRSVEEFRAITEGYDLSLTESGKMDVGMVEGFLISPFYKNRSTLESYVDLNPSKVIRDWMGGTQTYDGHPGTDFLANKGTEVVATAPGKILAAANDWPDNPNWKDISYYQNGNFVIIDCGNDLFTAYHHLDSIAVDETLWGMGERYVKRGQVIGYVGNTGLGPNFVKTNMPPHLHFQIWNSTGFMHGRIDALDPFRDLYYGKHGVSPWSNSVSLWTVDNEMQYL